MSLPPEPTGDDRNPLPEKRESGASPAPAPQKPISVDEMMQQLKSPDGKKRRRRSHQPIYESRRRRRTITIVLLSLATLSIGGCYGFRWFQKLRLTGDTFRDALNRRLSDELGCVVQLTRIHDGGESSLGASSGRLDLAEKDLLEYAEFDTINATLTSASWVSDEWGITSLNIGDAKFHLNPERALIKTDTTFIRPASKGREKSGSGGWRMGITPTPDTISLDKISVSHNFTLEWPAPDTERKTEGLSQVQAGAKPALKGGLDVDFYKGQLALKGLPEMPVHEAHWNLNGRKLALLGCNLDLGGGLAYVNGDIDLQVRGSAKLKVDFTKVPVRSLFSIAWNERLSGQINVKQADFTASFSEGPERSFEGDFSIDGLIIRDLSFVSKLAGHLALLQRPDFSRGIEFPSVTGHFQWSPSKGLMLTRLAGERPSELRLSGSLTATAQAGITASLNFAVHENVLRGQSAPHPFQQRNGEWSGVDFKLSGTGSAINDTLPHSGAVSAVPSPVPVPAPAGSGDSRAAFEDIIQPK